METKKVWWKSLTLWANVLAAVLELLNVPGSFGISPEYRVLAITLVNVVLRTLKTSQPLALTSKGTAG